MVEEPQVVVHEADQPDFLFDLFDADVLTGEHRTQVDLARAEADSAAHRQGDGAVMVSFVVAAALIYYARYAKMKSRGA